MDINGYSRTRRGRSVYFYPTTPCRVADTRSWAGFQGPFGPPAIHGGSSRGYTDFGRLLLHSAEAKAYSLNMTVTPPGPLSFLSTWPSGGIQLRVSTLNSFRGKVVANAAIVPAGINGAISIFMSELSDVIVDVNGYFAP